MRKVLTLLDPHLPYGFCVEMSQAWRDIEVPPTSWSLSLRLKKTHRDRHRTQSLKTMNLCVQSSKEDFSTMYRISWLSAFTQTRIKTRLRQPAVADSFSSLADWSEDSPSNSDHSRISNFENQSTGSKVITNCIFYVLISNFCQKRENFHQKCCPKMYILHWINFWWY